MVKISKLLKKSIKINTSDKLKEIGISDKIIKAIKKGYEGMHWNDWDKFISSFQGPDILIKSTMIPKGTYNAWNNDIKRISWNEAESIKKLLKQLKKW